jgi:hypothetical protein
MIPDNIKSNHILMALEEIDHSGVPVNRRSTKYQLFHHNNTYPPKYVISLANKYSNGYVLPPTEFSGGVESNDYLTRLGFKIIGKNSLGTKGIKVPDNKSDNNQKSGTKEGPKEGKEIKSLVHNQRCSDCKNTIIEMFRALYGSVKIEHKMQIKARLEDYINEDYYEDLYSIYNSLKNYRENDNFVRSNFLQPCDIYIPNPGFVVELDESQHFSLLRKESLKHYPRDLNSGFDVKKWIEQCDSIRAKDNNPIYRDEQRAWYDTLRDFLPLIKGMEPTIRISISDYNWCELDPNNKEDIAKFRSLVLDKAIGNVEPEETLIKSLEKVHLATVCLPSNGYYSNESRTNLLIDLIKKLEGKADLILLPAGYYETSKYPSGRYTIINEEIVEYMRSHNSKLTICLGVDGRNGLDQMGLMLTKDGIQSIGRNFYPTDFEEIDGAESYLSLEDGYSRLFELKGKRFYIAVCYDSFGIKNQRLKNTGVDVILDLVHQFHPKGEANSGDVLFAKHGFAGASKHWGCPTYGAAVFFNRQIPPNWPTGVIWDCDKQHTRNWRYSDNKLLQYNNLIVKDGTEVAEARFFEI